jgi:hypothetical protein
MISELRKLIAANLDGAPWEVYAFKPDDVTSVPCIVVDRPTVDINVQHWTFTTPVVVIGRRDGSEDAQVELDDATSQVVKLLAGPELAVVRIDPATATVAELTHPAYRITVSCGATECTT